MSSRYDSPPHQCLLTEDVILQRPPPVAPRKTQKRRPIHIGMELMDATTTPSTISKPTTSSSSSSFTLATLLNNDRPWVIDCNCDDYAWNPHDRMSPSSPPAPRRLFSEEDDKMIGISSSDDNHNNGNRDMVKCAVAIVSGNINEKRDMEQCRRSHPNHREGNNDSNR